MAFIDLAAIALGHAETIALFCGGAFALHQYRRQNHWQRKQFAAEQDKLFRNNPHVTTIVGILNWGELDAPLRPELLTADPARAVRPVSRKSLLHALTAYRDNRRLDTDQRRLLVSFDIFLMELAAFQKHLESGLVDEDDYERYFSYECSLVGGVRSVEMMRNRPTPLAEERKLQAAMMEYLHSWEYTEALALIARWHPISASPV